MPMVDRLALTIFYSTGLANNYSCQSNKKAFEKSKAIKNLYIDKVTGIISQEQFIEFNEDFQRVGVLGGILSCCQIIIILLSCIPVECALRRRFDSKGIRR